MIYLERLRAEEKEFFDASDASDLYLSSLVVASKYLHDDGDEEFVYNDEWAASASMPQRRLNRLELQMLAMLVGFRRNVAVLEEFLCRNGICACRHTNSTMRCRHWREELRSMNGTSAFPHLEQRIKNFTCWTGVKERTCGGSFCDR